MTTQNEPKHIAVTIFLILAVVAIAVLSASCSREGYQFVSGPKGADAIAPAITSQPAQSLDCPTGGVEVDVNGVKSGIVCSGGQGAIGQAGIDATIGILKFCPGTTIYPSEFNEIGLIVSGKVYAVYSVNNGFLAYLPPGKYTSDALNSRCSFTLNADNTVTN